MKKQIIGLLAVGILAAGSLTGCGSTAQSREASESPAAPAPESAAGSESAPAPEIAASESGDEKELSGSVTMSGSTSMEKLANALAETFMAKYPGVTVTAEFTGSSTGVESVLAGSVDIGDASRNLKDTEKSAGAVENIVAIDGIAVVTDPANTVTDLTQEQLISI